MEMHFDQSDVTALQRIARVVVGGAVAAGGGALAVAIQPTSTAEELVQRGCLLAIFAGGIVAAWNVQGLFAADNHHPARAETSTDLDR